MTALTDVAQVYLASSYADEAIKPPVRLVATVPITPIGIGQTIDGVVTAIGDAVLLAGQADARQNGVRIVSDGIWPYAPYFSNLVQGTLFTATAGVANAGQYSLTSSNPITLGVTALNFTTSTVGGLAAETAARIAADAALQANINSEASTRSTADSTEATTRASADTALQTNITAEATTRASADTTETSARVAGDALIVSNLAAPSGSSLVTFTQSGTGAAPRSLQGKERETISVTDFFANGVSGPLVDPTGVIDSTLGINAAINTLGGGGMLWFPIGTYLTTDEIVITGRDSVTLQGAGFNSSVLIYNSVTSNAAKGMVRLTNASNCKVTGMLLRPKPGGLGGQLGFGIYVTSLGSAVTQKNLIENCQIQNALDAGVQIGHVGTDIDTNVDGNEVRDCISTNSPVGVRVNDSNCNMTKITGGQITDNTTAGIEIGLNARGVDISRVLMNNNATKNIWIRNQNSGPISIRDMVCELGPASTAFLVADPSSGGVVDYNLLTLENINCTGNYTVPGLKMIDYQGTGSVHMRNCRFGGSASTSGGAGATLSFRPANALQGGMQTLITENVHLYDGAAWDVETNNTGLNAWFHWIDIDSGFGGTLAGDPPTNTRAIRINGGLQFQCRNLPFLALATGVTLQVSGYMGRQIYKITIDKTAWTAAALTQDIVLASIPAKCRIIGAYCDTTIKYAGLAGTIQLLISGTGTDGSIMAAHDVKTAIVTKGLLDADMGTGLTRAARIQDALIVSWTSLTQPQIRLTSGTGNIGTGTVTNLTTGSTDVYLITETMP